MIDELRIWIVGVISAVAAFLNPISGDIYSMLAVFGLNFLFGLIADIANNGGWSKKKMLLAFRDAGLFFTFAFFIYGIGYMQKNMQGAQQCVSFIVYSLLYFYTTNICRNGCIITREGGVAHAVFQWFFWILSVEFIKRIPYLKAYLEGKKPTEAVADKPIEENHLNNPSAL